MHTTTVLRNDSIQNGLQYLPIIQYTAAVDFILQFVQTNSAEHLILNSP